MSDDLVNRRNFLKKSAAILGSSLLIGPLLTTSSLVTAGVEHENVSPNEDLMQEHGLLRRVLLIYREDIRRIDSKEDLDPKLLLKSASIIRQFIEEYHEKNEENFLFPRFLKAGQLVDLVNTLKTQHITGRKITSRIITMAQDSNFNAKKNELNKLLLAFIHMYEPHAAREDTILFPAFERLVSKSEYQELGEQLENQEKQLFGQQGGFEGVLQQVADIEQQLGIYELSNFTPK